MIMTTSVPKYIRDLRDEVESLYDSKILTDDMIATIVTMFENGLNAKGYDPADIIAESQILDRTLRFSSNYNLEHGYPNE